VPAAADNLSCDQRGCGPDPRPLQRHRHPLRRRVDVALAGDA